MVHTVDRGAKRDRLVWVSIVSSTDNQSTRCSIQPPQQKHCVLHAKGETTRIAALSLRDGSVAEDACVLLCGG